MSQTPEELVEDLAKHGLRCDLNPTHALSASAADVEAFWHSYIKMVDKLIRDRAKACLASSGRAPNLYDVVERWDGGVIKAGELELTRLVVVSLDPFVLVGAHGTGVIRDAKPEWFVSLGQAETWEYRTAMARFRRNELEHRVALARSD